MQLPFNGTWGRQNDEVGMGSPLGPLLVVIFLAKPERGPLEQRISSLNMHTRYMDDTVTICDAKTDVNNVLSDFRNVRLVARFTMEMESDGFLLFPDVGERKR